jgi:hypothetical protein
VIWPGTRFLSKRTAYQATATENPNTQKELKISNEMIKDKDMRNLAHFSNEARRVNTMKSEKVKMFIIDLFDGNILKATCIACCKGTDQYGGVHNVSMRKEGLQIFARALCKAGFNIEEIREVLRVPIEHGFPSRAYTDEEVMEGEWCACKCVQVFQIIEAVKKRYPDPVG